MAANSLICPFTKHVTCEQPATGGGGWPARPDPAIFKKSLSLPRWRFFLYNLQPTNTGSSLREGQEGQQAGEPPGACLGERGPRGDVRGPREGTVQCRGGLCPLCPSSAHPQETQGQSLLPFHSHLGAGGGRRWQLTDGWTLSSPAPPRSPHPPGAAPASFPPWASAFRHPSAPARLSEDVCEGVLLPVLAWEAQQGREQGRIIPPTPPRLCPCPYKGAAATSPSPSPYLRAAGTESQAGRGGDGHRVRAHGGADDGEGGPHAVDGRAQGADGRVELTRGAQRGADARPDGRVEGGGGHGAPAGGGVQGRGIDLV